MQQVEQLYRRQRGIAAEHRGAWIAEQGGACRACGSTDDLQVDHVDPATKVDHRVWSWADDRRRAELAKCQLLCGACHRAKTRAEQWKAERHGNERTYSRHGCRCADCCRAHAAYQPRRRPNDPEAAAQRRRAVIRARQRKGRLESLRARYQQKYPLGAERVA